MVTHPAAHKVPEVIAHRGGRRFRLPAAASFQDPDRAEQQKPQNGEDHQMRWLDQEAQKVTIGRPRRHSRTDAKPNIRAEVWVTVCRVIRPFHTSASKYLRHGLKRVLSI